MGKFFRRVAVILVLMLVFIIYSSPCALAYDYEFETMFGQPYDINNNGVIIGKAWDGDMSKTVGFLYEGDDYYNGDNYTSYLYPDAGGTVSYGINDAGQNVGYYWPSDGHGNYGYVSNLSLTEHATIDITNPPYLVSDFNDGTTWNLGINNSGVIVGRFYGLNPEAMHGFRIDGESFTQIDFDGALHTAVTGINDDGQMVGIYYYDNHRHVFVMNEYLNIIAEPGEPNGWDSFAWGINNNNQIVGYRDNGLDYRTSDDYMSVGYIYNFEAGYEEIIEYPDAICTRVWGINDLGQIVGDYKNAEGDWNGFVATPTTEVPEAATGLLLGFGLIGLAGFRRKIKE